MIIKRDPVKDPPVDGDPVLVFTRGGFTRCGSFTAGASRSSFMSEDESLVMPWSDVLAWAPAEWTDAPTTDAARSPEEVGAIVDGLKAAFAPSVEEWKKVGDIDAELARMRGDDRDAYCAELVERAVIAEDNANVALTHSVQLKRERDRAIEERDAYCAELVERSTRAEKERDKWHAIYGEVAEERDRAIEERDALGLQLAADPWRAAIAKVADERDALGLQLAALRDQGERLRQAAEHCRAVARRGAEGMSPVDACRFVDRHLFDALTHGVDVTKEGE